jgi:hypothetical protein
MWKNIPVLKPDTMCKGSENKLVFFGNELVCTNGKNLVSSVDFGKTWQRQGKESDSIISIKKFACSGPNRIICGEKIRYVDSPVYSDDGSSVISYHKIPENRSFACISSDSGKTWNDVSSRFDKFSYAGEAGVTDSIFLLQWGASYYTSSDKGFTWKEYSSAEVQAIGLDFLSQLGSMFSSMMSFMFSSFSNALSIKIDLGCGNVSGFSLPGGFNGKNIYQQDSHLFILQNTGISYSAGPSKKWFEVSNSALQRGVTSLAFSKEYLYAMSSHYGLWRIKLTDLEMRVRSAP